MPPGNGTLVNASWQHRDSRHLHPGKPSQPIDFALHSEDGVGVRSSEFTQKSELPIVRQQPARHGIAENSMVGEIWTAHDKAKTVRK